ncbi:hypothetical protein [Streptomyces mirabilis]|uniref:hypothetical protein n=1 Tax=Streptomyces mirabilis TaxID=68239 RepID=UPI0033F47BEB
MNSTTTPRLEIVRRVPGTLWEPAVGGAVHHAVELERHGFVREATRKGTDGAPFAFLRSPASGYRVELVSRVAQQSLERFWGMSA